MVYTARIIVPCMSLLLVVFKFVTTEYLRCLNLAHSSCHTGHATIANRKTSPPPTRDQAWCDYQWTDP